MSTQVLLIDSDIAFMVAIKKALEGTGDYKVSLAANSWTADELLRHGAYDVAVVAFSAADMDVMVLLQRLRQIQPDLPVVLTPETPGEHERAALMDVQGTIGRPYVARDLRLVIDDAQRSEIRDLSPDEPGETRLLVDDEVEPPPPAGPFSDSAAMLDELEELERIQTGPLDEPPTDRPQTGDLAQQFDALFPADPFDFDESVADAADPRQTAPLSDLPDSFAAGGTPDRDENETHEEASEDAAEGHGARGDEAGEYSEFDEFGEFEVLDDIVIEDPPETRRLQDMQDMDARPLINNARPGVTQVLDDDEPPPDATRVLEDTPDEPPDTTTLLQWDEPEETRRLSGTEALYDEQARTTDTQHLEWREPPDISHPDEEDTIIGLTEDRADDYDPRPQTKPLRPLPGEPPRHPDDTPSVPDHDLDGVRQFLATDSTPDVDDFGAALDAVARYEVPGERSPEDRAFDELVDSLRVPDQDVPRRTRLEELLSSLAADTEHDLPEDRSTSALDTVLNAIRRGESPVLRREPLPDDIDLDDTTIGQVIDGLFDPSFEGVLAALAGEEVDEDRIDEPTYDAPDAPPTLPEEGRDAAIQEPPITPEDSRQYPATAALTAVAGEDDMSGDFSLDDLLRQIETQLPPARTYRPRLKPLPSWEQSELITGRKDIEALFDHAEGIEPERATRDDIAQVEDGAEPVFDDAEIEAAVRAQSADDVTQDEPDISQDDTRPSAALLEVMDSVQEIDTKPLGLVLPDEMYEPEPLDAAEEVDKAREVEADDIDIETGDALEADEEAKASDEHASLLEFEQDDEAGLLTMDDLLAIADLPVEAGTEEIQAEIARRAAAAQQAAAQQAAAQQGERAGDEARAPGRAWEHEAGDDALPDAGVGIDGVDRAAEERDSHPFEAGEQVDFHPDDSQMITVPADTAARLIETETSPVEDIEVEEENARLAALAVQLTQFSLESSAQATIIARAGERLAEAGDLPDDAMDDLFELMHEAWQSSPAETDSLIRFVALPEAGEFLLYSTLVEHDLSLSMVFHSDIPVRTIRRQAQRLSESLELVPDTGAAVVSETLPSRPTDLKPPVGWSESVEGHGLADEQVSAPVRPDREGEGPLVAYTCLWLPADPALELEDDFADAVARWIEFIADDSAWLLGDLDILPDYILLTLHVPQKMLPDEVITWLMSETERLASEHFPLLVSGKPLWTDGYYVVSPPRDLSEREIARFITYQRQAQLG